MEHLTTTPFGRRSVAAGLVARAATNRQFADSIDVAAGQVEPLDKWSLFRDLTTARQSYDLGDRTLMVLNALLTFLPEKELRRGAQLIVFPSNRSLADRCHGMAESTLRRHLAALVDASLITRHDSPNGKRYARRAAGGRISHAFGFDLSPLLFHANDIISRAEEARRLTAEIKLVRERISLLRRDAVTLAQYVMPSDTETDWTAVEDMLSEFARQLRRKLSLATLHLIEGKLVDILADIREKLDAKSEQLSVCDNQNERHQQRSEEDKLESEQHTVQPMSESRERKQDKGAIKPLPLTLVLEACPEIKSYSQEGVRDWHGFVRTADLLRGMMGIDHTAWEQAKRRMGAENAAVTLACILQRFGDIRNPGGYLRSLTAKSAAGCFSPTPMVMALLNNANRVAA